MESIQETHQSDGDSGESGVVEVLLRYAEAIDSRHRVTNIRVATGQHGHTARATSYLDALLVRQGSPGGDTFQVIGTYHDSLRRDDSNWKISERAFQRLWSSGDPSIMTPSGE